MTVNQLGSYRIGVDVGGTNTDAAIIDVAATETPSRGVRASSKSPTTADVTSGIYTVIENVLAKSQVNRKEVLSVAIGTTHFVNAVVEADSQHLTKVAVVRLCGPFARSVPPFADFPQRLRKIMEGPIFYLDGGLEIDGRQISTISPNQIKETVECIRSAGISAVAIVGVFSPVDHEGIQETACKTMMLKLEPSLSVVCSHSIGSVGFLERENATILNASILRLAQKTVRAFCRAMSDLHLDCPLFLTQNDGTLTDAATAAEFPIKTFTSGPTSSMTGAAYLASLDRGTSGSTASETQVLVVDVGGTTSDICALLPSGFPRQAPNFVDVGGVRTAFSMPEVVSIGLGGGSRVRVDETSGKVSVGPDSVGYRLQSEALVFGGTVMTSTDIVVACGNAEIGDPSKVKDASAEVINKARAEIKKILERAVEDMKVSDLPVTLLLVGGGSIIHMDALEGVAECIIPPHYDCANAVGAAIAKVAGEVDVIEILENRDEKTVVEAAKQQAIQAAVARGADRDDVKIVGVEKIPLQYVTNKAIRLVIKAVGKLAQKKAETSPGIIQSTSWMFADDTNDEETPTQAASSDTTLSSAKYSAHVDIETYMPNVKDKIWYLSPVDLEFIATGTGVLGTGGGGPSYLQYLECLQWLQESKSKGRMRVIALGHMQDSDVCVFGSWYGAPSVSSERLPAGTEIMTAIDHSVRIAGHTHFEAVIADEIGGGNGMSTFPTSAYYDIPVIDGDLMGRAYPTMEHGTPYVYGHPITPCVLADGKGNVGVVLKAESNTRVEGMLRSQCVNLGLMAAAAATPLTGDIIKKYAIPNTVSQAWYIGRAIHKARRSKTNIVKAIFDTTPGQLLYTGKVVDVKRDVSRGYTMGQCTIAPLPSDEREFNSTDSSTGSSEQSRYMVIPFQNEFLYAAYADSADPDDPARQEIICTVPDLISILDQNGEAIGSQELRYGLKVDVIAMAAHPLWTGDDRALRVGGPKGFGLDMEWKSIGPYQGPKSVIAEFNQE